jgi:hypothetical protein
MVRGLGEEHHVAWPVGQFVSPDYALHQTGRREERCGMHVRNILSLNLAGVILTGLLLAAQPVKAANEARPCPAEPTQNVTITSGYVFAGTNCTIGPITDLDSFRFSGTANHVYRIALALNGGANGMNLCFELHGPSGLIRTQCTNTPYGVWAAVWDQKLPGTGVYTIVVSEAGNDQSVAYAISLQRLYTAPSERRTIEVAQSVNDEILPLTDSDTFGFYGNTQSTYRLTVTMAFVTGPNICASVFGPDSGTALSGACTNSPYGVRSVTMDIKPRQNGTHLILIAEGSYRNTVTYTVNLQCLLACDVPPPPPPCTLRNAPAYSSGLLTMRFNLGTLSAATWNAWLTSQNGMRLLWSVSQPKTDPAVVITKTASVGPVGKVAILSTLTTPARGIICYSLATANTGTPPGLSAEPSLEDEQEEDEPEITNSGVSQVGPPF